MKVLVSTSFTGTQPTAQVAPQAQWLAKGTMALPSVRGSEVANFSHAPFGVAGVPFCCIENDSVSKNALPLVAAPR